MYRSDRGAFPHGGNVYSHIKIDRAAAPDQPLTEACRRLAHLSRKYGGWKSYRRARTRLVVADRSIPYKGGHDVHPGQVCVALETAGLGAGKRFDGLHVVRYWDPAASQTIERVAHVRRIVSGPRAGHWRLSWGRSHDALVVKREDVTFVASVIGLYAGDRSPVLWMYAN